jgi:chaperonin GroES
MAAYVHPSLRNLAPDLIAQGYNLADLSDEIVDEFKKNRESRSVWDEMHAKWVKLYYQIDKPVSTGRWPGASDESVPILTEACNQYHTRMYTAMFSNRRLVVARPSGRSQKADLERAERVGLHMTWQLTHKNREYIPDKDSLLLSLPLHGTMFTKVYRDPWRNQNVVRNVRAVDLMTPYGIGPRTLEDIPSKTEVIWTTVNDTLLLEKVGYFSGHGVPTEMVQDWINSVDVEVERATGVTEAHGTEDLIRPVLLLESHRLIDLDGDGIAEPYIVVVDAESKAVLRVAIRYETDELGNPVSAPWYDSKKPIEYYTAYHFLKNPDGFLGLGLGHMLGELNKACNRLLREQIDAGCLANIGNHSGFISSALAGPHGGEIAMELGKFKKIEASVEDLNKAIYTFKFPGPNQAGFNALQLLLGRSDRLGLNTEAVTGQLERTLQPTTILALLEQSNQGFGSVNQRVVQSWGDELQKLYGLNYKHMDPEEYFSVLDISGSPVDQAVARDDYRPDMQIEPSADPKMASEKERLQKAQMEYQLLINEPLVMADPTMMSRYNVVKDMLIAMRSDNIDSKLPNPLMLQMQGVNVAGMMATMQGAGKDESGLTESGSGAPGGAPGLAQGPGNAGGFPPIGAGSGNGKLENGSKLGGSAPGAGASTGPGLAQ